MPLFGGPPNVTKLAAKGDIPGLARALAYAKDQGEVRRAAVGALCQSADARAVEPLITALGYRHNDQPMRMAIVVALGRFGDPRAVEPLVVVLRSRPAGDMRNAADRELAQKEGDVRNAAAHSLAQIGSPAVKPLVSVLGDKGGDGRTAAAGALLEIGSSAVAPLITALGDKAWVVQLAAIEVLGRIGDPRAVEPLVAALNDQRKHAAVRALEALAWSPDRGAAGAIYWASRGEWDKCVQIGGPAVDPLIAVLRSRNDADGWGAHARAAAAEALGRIGDTRAVEPLVEALDDQDRVWLAAAEALDHLAWNPDGGTSGAAYWVAKDGWDECVRIGAPAVKRLIAILDDSNENRRTGASLALGEIGAPAIDPLVAVLKKGGGKGAHAARVLGMIDDARVFEPLYTASVANERDVRKVAAEQLVVLYRSGKLNEAQKTKLLAQRGVITASHLDRHEEDYQPGCYLPAIRHTDREGLGVDFPL